MNQSDKKHLFIVCQNNSGSTLLYRCLNSCSKVIKLSTEGQLIYGPRNGPVNMEKEWGGLYFGDNESVYEDNNNYNWGSIKCLWNADWKKNSNYNNASVLMEKSPPNILRASLLQENFDNSYFILMVRNPYAVCEGMRRRLGFDIKHSAYLWTVLSKKQIENSKVLDNNILITYEEFCNERNVIKNKLINFLPDLDDINLENKVCVHSILSIGEAPASIENYNEIQIKNLSKGDIEIISDELKKNIELLNYFGYELL